MEQHQERPQQDKLYMSANVDPQNKPKSSSQLMINEKIGNSPIFVNGNEEQGYWASLGYYRLTEATPNKQDIIDAVTERDWNIIIGIVAAMLDIEKQHASIQDKVKAFENELK